MHHRVSEPELVVCLGVVLMLMLMLLVVLVMRIMLLLLLEMMVGAHWKRVMRSCGLSN